MKRSLKGISSVRKILTATLTVVSLGAGWMTWRGADVDQRGSLHTDEQAIGGKSPILTYHNVAPLYLSTESPGVTSSYNVAIGFAALKQIPRIPGASDDMEVWGCADRENCASEDGHAKTPTMK